MTEKLQLAHVNSHMQCLVFHTDKDGNALRQCIVCQHCGQYIRPEKMNETCPVRHAKWLEEQKV